LAPYQESIRKGQHSFGNVQHGNIQHRAHEEIQVEAHRPNQEYNYQYENINQNPSNRVSYTNPQGVSGYHGHTTNIAPGSGLD